VAGGVRNRCSAHISARSSVNASMPALIAPSMLRLHSITASATWPACPAGLSGKQPGCVVSVTVTYPFEFLAIKFIPGMQNPLMTMSSTSQMVISQ